MRVATRDAAFALGLQINALNAATAGEIDAAFAVLGREGADALFVGGDSSPSTRNSSTWL